MAASLHSGDSGDECVDEHGVSVPYMHHYHCHHQHRHYHSQEMLEISESPIMSLFPTRLPLEPWHVHGLPLGDDVSCDVEKPQSHPEYPVLFAVESVVALLAASVAVAGFVADFWIVCHFSPLVMNLVCPQHQRTLTDDDGDNVGVGVNIGAGDGCGGYGPQVEMVAGLEYLKAAEAEKFYLASGNETHVESHVKDHGNESGYGVCNPCIWQWLLARECDCGSGCGDMHTLARVVLL